MDSKKKFIEQINDFKKLGLTKINETKSYLAPVFKKGTEALVKLTRTWLVKASVAYRELEPVVIQGAKQAASILQQRAKQALQVVEGKFGKIHFDFHHFVMTSGVAVVVFALSFTLMANGRSKVSAAVLEAPVESEVKAYNKETIAINYGDDSAIVDTVKELLAEDVASVNEAKAITLHDGTAGYEIGNYIVSIDQEATRELKEDVVTINIQTKETYEREDFGKAVIKESTPSIKKEDGAIHSYTLNVKYVDTQAPVVTLKETEVEIDDVDAFYRRNYVESIVDNYDGILSDFTIEGEIPEKDEERWKAGEYTLVYKAVDSSGNVGSASLKVKVNATEDEAETTKAESSDEASEVSMGATEVAPSSSGEIIAAAALAQVGVGQDCTMLVTNSLAAAGIYYHGWPAGYLSLGTIVSASEAQPGDIIYYADGGAGMAHVAVYIGGGQAVHGGWLGTQTVIYSAYVGSGPVFIRIP